MKKYAVFLSSTHADLESVRMDLIQEVLLAGCFPVAAELFGARDQGTVSAIEQEIETSDFFFLIVGKSYGTIVGDGETRTFIELEFDLAQRLSKPIRIYVYKDAESNNPALAKFIEQLRHKKSSYAWSNADDLLRRVASDLRDLIAGNKSGTSGWIPAKLAWNPNAATRIESVFEKLETQISQISTQYLGMFPSYMPRIVDLIGKGGDEIAMVCDVPGYGVFSAPRDKYAAYEQALWTAHSHDRSRLSAVFYSENERREELANQFSNEDWDAWKMKNAPKLEQFYKRPLDRQGRGDISEYLAKLDRDQFVSDCLGMHRSIQERVFDGDYVREFNARYPFHFWVNREQCEAIFSFPTYPSVDDRAPAEHGFFTRDPQLADSLLNLFRYFWKMGNKEPQ